MNESDAKKFVQDIRAGRLNENAALKKLRGLPYEDLGFAKIDHHRSLRQGFAEVVYGRGKTPQQIAAIVRGMLRAKASHNILVTRASAEAYRAVKRESRAAKYHELSGTIAIQRSKEIGGKGLVLVITAGTSDIPVAEEAQVSAESMGNRCETIYDVGVAGLHRLMEHRKK